MHRQPPPDPLMATPTVAASSSSSPRWQSWLLKGLGILGLGVGIVVGVRMFPRDSTPPPVSTGNILPVETVTVEPVTSYQVERNYTGEIAALRASNLGFERGGEVVEVLVAESDRVLVRGTLQTGDRLVASGVHRLVPGQLVHPLP